MHEVTEMTVSAVRYNLAWRLSMLRRGQREVRRLSTRLSAARGRTPDLGRLLNRYRRLVGEDAAAALQLRVRLAEIDAGAHPRPRSHQA